MANFTPSRVRDYCESRIRKLAQTYSLDERIKAIDEVISRLQQYREQLITQRSRSYPKD